jgi:23S rRNA (cytosine1962-C5)-methyltransferase
VIHEGPLAFYVSLPRGQKTGFYLDQRDNRRLVGQLARDRRVLNLFCYTGAFSVAAARSGAREIISVDGSAEALEAAKRNMEMNGVAPGELVKANAFQYLRDAPIRSDLIILDPPALARTKGAVQNACRGYKDLHLQVAAKCPPGSLLLTCSCSRFVDMDLFQKVVFGAFADAGRRAVIIGKYGQPCDHPTSLFCPETEYLKALLLSIE